MEFSENEKKKKHSKAGLAFQLIGSYFNIMPDKEDEAKSIKEINSGVQFSGANLWVLIFAIFIASLGLNMNSTAVIIGAMLISPVMGPIIGIGLGLGIKDYLLLRRSVKNYLLATVISVVTATIYFLISPYEGEQSELLARTSPTLYDVLIAFFGGMAGVVALCTKGKGNVIPGVAIATALMPPLCTAGFGLATANWAYFLGAFYLFFINTVFIGLATFIGVKVLRFKQVTTADDKQPHLLGKFIVLGIIVSLVPATIMTFKIVTDGLFNSAVQQYIKEELDRPGTEILAHEVDKEAKVLEVIAIGREIKEDVIHAATEHMARYGLKDYKLQVVQGEHSENVINESDKLLEEVLSHQKSVEMLQVQSQQINDLKKQLNEYTRYGKLSVQMKDEVNVLFPDVESVRLAVADELLTDSVSASVPKQVVAIVQMADKASVKKLDTSKLREWLQVRVAKDSITLVVMPIK